MHPSLQREIPEFLHDSLLYCDSLTYNKNEKSCFVLTKNLKFYEFRKKQLLHCIDLNESCLAELKERILMYDGRKCKWLDNPADKEKTATDSEFSGAKTSKITSQESFSQYEIKFGKYIYKSFDVSKLYLLLNCWNKLIVLQRLTDTTTIGFRFITEYENVANFKVVPSSMMKHQAVVKIKFSNGKSDFVDFEEHDNCDKALDATNLLQQKSEFKQLLERVRHTKAELQFHKEITHKKFQSLKNKQVFGNNFVRSVKLDEKPMLSRCGDVWIRITSSDELVIGLPLVNNCTPANLTIFKNLQPVLNINNLGITSACLNNMHYVYRIYQLQQTFENLETLETFFQSEDAQFVANAWSEIETQVLPTTFVVLLLKFRLSQIMLINEKCQIFVRFQIEKELPEFNSSETHAFEQHVFIKTLDFQEILLRRQEYQISFLKTTLQQDLLALSITSFRTNLEIDFATYADRSKFEHLLALKFDFEIVHREEFNVNTSMEVDENPKAHKCFPCTLFYNRKPNSLWFASLIMRAADRQSEVSDNCDTLRTTWTFYNKNEEKFFLMFKILLSELIAFKCNVIAIKHGEECQSNDLNTCNFENAMRQELSAFLDIINNKYVGDALVEKIKFLMKLQYKTDITASLSKS